MHREDAIVGTWGINNFDNDGALDFVNSEVDRLVATINAIFADESIFRLDEDAESILMPSIVILVMLCEHCDGVLPDTLDVVGWRDRYLAMFDDQVDDLKPIEIYRKQRRAVIEATFHQLEQFQRKEPR